MLDVDEFVKAILDGATPEELAHIATNGLNIPIDDDFSKAVERSFVEQAKDLLGVIGG